MNSAKLYSYENGYILVTVFGKFHITNDYIRPTDISVDGLTESVWDINITAMIDNASTAIASNVSFDFSRGLALLAQDKVEDFD